MGDLERVHVPSQAAREETRIDALLDVAVE